MECFILKDMSIGDLINPFNNFSREINKWLRFGKIIEPDCEIQSGEIVVVNVHKSIKLDLYNIPDSAKIISVVHEIDKNSRPILEKSNHVIFLNKYQEMFAKTFLSFNGRCTVCPRFPLKTFPVKFDKENIVYIGGLLTYDKLGNLHNIIDEFNIKLPRNIKFLCDFVVPEPFNEVYVKQFEANLNSKQYLAKKVSINIKNNQSYEKMLFNILCCRYAYIWDEGPAFNDFESRIIEGDKTLINSVISDSAMLSHIQSANCEFFLEDRVKFQAFFNKENNFTYKDFAKELEIVVKESIK